MSRVQATPIVAGVLSGAAFGHPVFIDEKAKVEEVGQKLLSCPITKQ